MEALPRFRPLPGRPVLCAYCRQPVEAASNSDTPVCARRECQTRKQVADSAKIARLRQQRQEDWMALTQRRTRPAIKAAAREIGQDDLRHVAYGLAPRINMPIIPLPEERLQEFVDHLAGVVDASFEATPLGDAPPPPEDDPGYKKRVAEEPPEPFVINATCIACQGDCCLQGARTQAFLTKETIDYIRWRDPSLTRQEILDRYLSHLPETSTTRSCVYHGPQGCTLDRTWRADICNSFQCGFRQKLMDEYRKKPGNGAVVAGISRDHVDDPSAGAPYLRVVSVSEDHEVRVHSHLKLPAVRKGLPKRE